MQSRFGTFFFGVILLSASCYESRKLAPEILFVDPYEITQGVSTEANVIGRNFFTEINEDLGSSEAPTLDMGFEIRIGDLQLPDNDVVYVNTENIDIVIPAELEKGTYSITVVTPGGLDGILEDAIHVGSGTGDSLVNVVVTSNGGVLESFTSEYCVPDKPPGDCEEGYWDHTNINDGEHAHGSVPDAFRAAWASAYKGGYTDPEEFIFSFADGRSALIEQVVIQNYGYEEGYYGYYYSSHFLLYGESPGSNSWFLILDEDLDVSGDEAHNETPQVFDLTDPYGDPVLVGRLRFAITSGVSPRFWDIGEFEAWGYLK